MRLHKEVLHSTELKAILKEFSEGIKNEPGLKPDEYSNEDLYMLYSLAHRLYEVDDYENAEPVFRRLILARPFEIRHWQAIASCQYMQKKYEESLVSWSMCCLIEEKNATFHYWSALCLDQVGQRDEAITTIEKALSLAEGNTSLIEKITLLLERWKPNNGEALDE